MNLSQEYLSALVVVIMGILQLLKIESTPEQVMSLIIVVSGAWAMFRRYKKGDINLLGKKV